MTMIRNVILRVIYLAVSLLHIAVSLIVGISAWIFYALAGLLLLVTICCFLMGVESGDGIRHMLAGCGILFAIPLTASLIDAMLEVAAEAVSERM